jgi:membrane protein YqaA with SNARE-associated domain
MLADSLPVLSAMFVSAFLSSTLLPGNSEVVLIALLVDEPQWRWPLLGAATAGNTLGALTSYAIGRIAPAPRSAPRALRLAARYGVPLLLLSWVPVIGDALCVASGWLRHDPRLAALAIAAGKFARYWLIAEGVLLVTR